ncbi:hypothetical protein GGR06_002337 [Bacteroides reticulotermitis]|uniref:Tetratricopeptide repeat protein n=1 Tax=Bacteroides reticulotermitis TaxID=1133319 RepID=A0A840D7Z9_9BACE|nr:DUF6340 family protein [Bacteroides reticulotermitis]MBB4044542.1 hypothetical protein [Bacteroides reticulotermitis]HJD76690.1 DUF6340 family protein [Bacteroides reticulotermitis]
MAKSCSLICISLIVLTLSGCQTIEQLSIDYMQPAEITFPAQLRKVAVVNNTSVVPDNNLLPETEQKEDDINKIRRATAYSYGDSKLAVEALAEEIANQNYFDEVVICDSALRALDILPRENTLSPNEVNRLTNSLGVDLLISLENLQIQATKTISYQSEYGVFRGVVDVKTYPTIKVYLPERSTPMVTIIPKDSIFWERYGSTEKEVLNRLISDTQIVKEASTFAGISPVKQLIPYWRTEDRFLYTGGSVNMRDAAIYVREDSWDNAYELWKKTYDESKGNKKKMRAALNIALYYEMKDNLPEAENWARKAQEYAQKIEKLDKVDERNFNFNKIPNFILITKYLVELTERNSQIQKLNMQMQRFNNDF